MYLAIKIYCIYIKSHLELRKKRQKHLIYTKINALFNVL